MDESLVDAGLVGADPLGLSLRSALPDEYSFVSEPVVRGRPLDAVVIGPQGLFVLHVREWEGEIRPTQRGTWRERSESGRVVSHPSPAREAQRATRELRAFLRDEFPSLRPAIYHFVVLTKPGARVVAYGGAEPSCVRLEDVAREIAAVAPAEPGLDRESRESLALALHERQLTASQRASQPFIFRSSSFLGLGRKAWTIRQVVKQMDKRPAEGIHHLRNGSLERWLSDQGALHLAPLAREAVRESSIDRRVSLETFLLGTGLVRRPRISIKPRRLDFGYVLSGENTMRRLRARKGQGRGYLIGSLQASDPWLRVEPADFRGSHDPLVSIDTEPLMITEQPAKATILVESNASDRPIPIPVRIHVEPVPAGLSRYLLRPLAGLLVAAMFGAVVGWYLGGRGVRAPAWLTGRTSPPLTSKAGWALLTAFFWSLLGTIRGIYQPLAWPIAYAIRRWLSRTFFWGVTLCFLTAAALGLTAWLYPDVGRSITEATRQSFIAAAVAAAILPGTVGEILTARARRHAAVGPPQRTRLRTYALAAAAVALVFLILAGVRMAGPALEQYAADARVKSVQEWATHRLVQWEAALNGLRDDLFVHLYDRRAPAGSASVAPTPTALPSGAE